MFKKPYAPEPLDPFIHPLDAILADIAVAV
jgi:hypothetical protein